MNHQTASAPGTPGTRHARRPVRAVRAAVVLAAFALAAAACGTSDDDDADAAACDTVGYVMYGAESSPGNDSDWDTLIHTAAVATAESTGTEALFERNVAGGTLFLPAVDRLVDQGACIVFATSADYIFAVDEAAERRPDVRFLNAGGFNEWSDDSPFGVYDARMYEARFLHGVIAAGNSPSGTVGYVASTDAPEVYRGLNFFALGARFVDPDVRVLVEWTGDWQAGDAEAAAATSLLAQGADVIAHHQDGNTVPLTVQAWNDDNGTSVRYTSFLSLGDAPQNRNTAWLAGAVIDWKPVFAGVVDSVADGTYEPTTIWQGVAESVVQTDLPAGTPAETMPNAPAAVRAGIPALFADVLAGDIDLVFTPPPGAGAPPFPDGIATSDGRVLTPAELLSDDILGAMDFLVEGIVGADGPADRRFTS